MTEQEFRPGHYDFSNQPEVVGELIRAEIAIRDYKDLIRQAKSSLHTEQSKFTALQKEVNLRANRIIIDVFDFAHNEFGSDDKGVKLPRNFSLKPSLQKRSFTASRIYEINDNDEQVAFEVRNKRTTLRGKIIQESVTILKPGDHEFKLSISTETKRSMKETHFHAKDGRGSQDLSRGTERHPWQGRQYHKSGHENDSIIDVLSSFEWLMQRLHHPIKISEISTNEDKLEY